MTDPEPARPARSGWNAPSLQTLIAITATLTSLAAIYLAWQQATIMRAQQHASVIPILYSGVGFRATGDNQPTLSFAVTNAGVGPAKIRHISLSHSGQSLESWSAFEEAHLPEVLRGRMSITFIDQLERKVLQATERHVLFELEWPTDPDVQAAFGRVFEQVVQGELLMPEVGVCYCSVFDRCWETQFEAEPVRVETCPISTNVVDRFFQQKDGEES